MTTLPHGPHMPDFARMQRAARLARHLAAARACLFFDVRASSATLVAADGSLPSQALLERVREALGETVDSTPRAARAEADGVEWTLALARHEAAGLVVVARAPRAFSRGEIESVHDVAVIASAGLGSPQSSPDALYRAAAGHLPKAAVLMFDTSLHYVLAEGLALFATVGLTREDLIGRRAGLFAPSPAAIEDLCRATLVGASRSQRIVREGKTFTVTTSPVFDASGAITHGLLFAYDETERASVEATLVERARRDLQTGLLNREGFMSAVASELAQPSALGCLLFVDLDGLKAVNDREGHAAGDRMIAAAADVLRSALRAEDHVGRLGGDEFAAFVPGEQDGTALVARIQDAAARVGVQQGTRVALSIGAVPCRAGDRLGERLSAADHAMYADKARRRRAC